MGGLGGTRFHRTSVRSPQFSGFSSFSTDEAFRAYNFPMPIPAAIPSVVFQGHPHVPASGVSSPTPPVVSLLRSLTHGDLSVSSASNLTLSGWSPLAGVVPAGVAPAPPAIAPSSSPVASSSSSSSSTSLAPLAKPSLCPAEPFKLSDIKDVKGYLDMQDEIAYYL